MLDLHKAILAIPFILESLHSQGVNLVRVQSDSRKILPGDIFLACQGEFTDGRDFIQSALERGAQAVLWEPDGFEWTFSSVPQVPVPQLSELAGFIADAVNRQPSACLPVIGVTGTNGKTSCTHWLAQAFNHLQQKTALVGTVGNGFYGALEASTHTTPDAVTLQNLLADFQQAGAQRIAMEVSSHGLSQARVNGVRFDVAVFTNLSRDHLDYHGNMEAYASAKARLFESEGLRAAVLNAEDLFGQTLASRLKTTSIECWTYGLQQGDVRTKAMQMSAQGMRLEIETPLGGAILNSHLIGGFNALNLLACLSTLLASGIPLLEAVTALQTIHSAPGRMQTLGGGIYPSCVIDYAHTPDALDNVLQTLREILPPHRQLKCVMGCGGDRDTGKRPLMGEIATLWADEVILTNDNPRTEDPIAILEAIEAGCRRPVQRIPDREQAIQHAILSAQQGDIVLIAGKGHEDYQEIQGIRHAFSDVEHVKLALAQWKNPI